MTISTRNAFTYGVAQSLGDTAVTYTLTAARWGVLTYDFLTCDEAKQTYRWVKDMTIALGQLAFWSAVWVYAKAQSWVDAEVSAALPTTPAEADPFDPAINPLEIEHPFVADVPVVAMAAAIAPPVAALTVPVTEAKPPTTAELRQRCQDYNKTLAPNDPRRIKRAARLTKEQALAALAKV
jgi:hypothetical protein